AIMPARVRAREADPIFVLAGGPGQGAVSLASQVLPLFARLNDVRDIVLVDQRGTGNSNPLDCEDDEEPALQSLFEDTLPEPLVARCLAALTRLIEACDAEVLCKRTYPRLRETIATVRGQLARRAAHVGIQDPRTGERETISVNENVFLSGLFRPLYVAELASLLPLGISAAAAGDFNPLLAQNLEFADDVAENLSLGLHLSVICAEDVPRITEADLATLGGSFFGRALVDNFIRACGIWP